MKPKKFSAYPNFISAILVAGKTDSTIPEVENSKNQQQLFVLGHKITPYMGISGDFDMVTGETQPEIPGPPAHFHKTFQELFLVLEGEMEFTVNNEIIPLKKGEMIDLPVNSLHTFRNTGTTPCKWLNIHSPKGFLSFFKTYGIAASEKNALQKSIVSDIINQVGREAADYDMNIQK